MKNQKGFTIIELLVVIVVIGILAVVTIISYVGIQQRARIAIMQSDLRNSHSKIAVYYTDNSDVYPNSIALLNLPKDPTTDYAYSKTAGGYCMTATSNIDASIIYHISSSTGGQIESGECPKIIAYSAGGYHTCAVGSDQHVYCWGLNNNGQLGNDSITSSYVPVPVDTTGPLAGKLIMSVSAGNNVTCALDVDEKMYCWGLGTSGQLGNGLEATSRVPVEVDMTGALAGKTIKSMSVSNSTCVLASDSRVYCWGMNSYGALGIGNNDISSIPQEVGVTGIMSGKAIKAIASNADGVHNCAIDTDGLAYCWGKGDQYDLGNGINSHSNVPVAVTMDGKTFKSIASGSEHICAVDSNDLAYCWGYGNSGRLGNNSTSNSTTPSAVYTASGPLNGKTVKMISAGVYFTCAVASDDMPYCWGYNVQGQLGNGNNTYSAVPVTVVSSGVLSGKTVSSLDNGAAHVCAFASDNNYYCWGYNGSGYILGDGLSADSNVPVAAQLIP